MIPAEVEGDPGRRRARRSRRCPPEEVPAGQLGDARDGFYKEMVTGPPGFEPVPIGKSAVASQHPLSRLLPQGPQGWQRLIEDPHRGDHVVVPQREVPDCRLRVLVPEEVADDLEWYALGPEGPPKSPS